MKYTKSQNEAINKIDGNVLVSASAGSGKTAVMIERVINLIINHNVSVRELLVLTFANDASSEIRQRLLQALKVQLEQENVDKEYISKQIDDLGVSSMLTIHAFCLEIIKTYFYKINLNPNFSVITESDLDSLKQEALEEVISDYIESDDNDFLDTLEVLKTRRKDKSFKETILKIYNYAISRVNFDEYLNNEFLNSYSNIDRIKEYVSGVMIKRKQEVIDELTHVKDACEKFDMPKCAMSLSGRIMFLNSFKLFTEQEVPAFSKGEYSSKLLGAQLDISLMYKSALDLFKGFTKEFCDKLSITDNALNDEATRGLLHMKKLSEVAIKFKDKLNEKKTKKSMLDFNDFEHYALQLIEDEEVRKQLENKYKYIFVDEYQDTNAVQECLISKISKSNVFMVGDLKQSIYAFRQCDPTIFKDKYHRFNNGEDGSVIELNANFRSHGGVLDFCNEIFSNIMTYDFGGIDYNKSSMFVSGMQYEKDSFDKPCNVHIINSEKLDVEYRPKEVYDVTHIIEDEENEKAVLEGKLIANLIDKYVGSEIYDSKLKAMRTVGYGDIAILTRAMGAHATTIRDYLLVEANLPIISSASDKGGIEVALLQDYLEVLSNPMQDLPLVSVMRSVFGGFSDEELATIKNKAKQDGFRHEFFYQAVEHCKSCKDFSLHDKLIDFYLKISQSRQKLQFKSISNVLIDAININGYDKFLLSQTNGRQRLVKVYNFLSMLEGSFQNFDLQGYLLSLKTSDEISYGETAMVNSNAVKMMTMHKSKGLEFPIVILCGCSSTFNFLDLKNKVFIDKDFGGTIDDYLLDSRVKSSGFIKEAVKMKMNNSFKEEELRLFYVAMTRACNHLDIILYENEKSMENYKGKRIQEASKFSEFIFQGLLFNYDSDCYVYYDSDIKNLESDINEETNLQILNKLDKDFDPILVEKFKSMLNFTYDTTNSDLKQKYTVTNVAYNSLEFKKIENSFAIDRGIFYHYLIEKADILNVTMDELSKISKCYVGDYKFNDNDLQVVYDFLSLDFFKTLQGYKLYKEQEFMLNIHPSEIGQEGDKKVLLQGKIDLLAVKNDEAIIIDFKSGRIGSEENAIEKYGKQLRLYEHAVKKSLKIEKISSFICSITEKSTQKIKIFKKSM